MEWKRPAEILSPHDTPQVTHPPAAAIPLAIAPAATAPAPQS
jgi:hypothetical protein